VSTEAGQLQVRQIRGVTRGRRDRKVISCGTQLCAVCRPDLGCRTGTGTGTGAVKALPGLVVIVS
jgi:hypothetical protein